MQTQLKRISQEDGRTIMFYHFPETATESESAAFASLPSEPVDITATESEDLV